MEIGFVINLPLIPPLQSWLIGDLVMPRIPLVDLSGGNLKPGSESWNSTCQDVRKALEEYGCLELVYDKPCVEFHNTILEVVDELFQLPNEIKVKNANPKPAHGYMGKISVLPILEGMGIENATNKQECQNFTNLMWPHGNYHFCETVHSFAMVADEVQQLLVKMLCKSYGIEKEYTESLIKSTTNLVRFMKYKKTEGDTNVGFKVHTDKSFFSILHQNQVKGLDIRTKDGDWIPYRPSSCSSFVVQAGDACMAWSNDRIKSCYHRVIIESEEVRYSVGYFSFLTGLIKAPEQLVDEEHPLQYMPFDHQQLIHFFYSTKDPNKDNWNIVKVYSGI